MSGRVTEFLRAGFRSGRHRPGWLTALALGWSFADPFDPLDDSHHGHHSLLMVRVAP